MTDRIRILGHADEARWNAFVAGHDQASFFHQMGWRNIVTDNYHTEPIYLFAENNDRITGILPLMITRNGFTGRKLVSVPHAVIGGVCAQNDAAARSLVTRAKELTREHDLDYLELKNVRYLENGLLTNTNYYDFSLTLDPDPEQLWKQFHNEMRRCVRRGKEHNLELRYTDDLDIFYRIFSLAHRELGTPVNSRKWIESIMTAFPEHHKILLALYEGKPVAVMLIREFNSTAGAVFGYMLQEHRKRYPLYVMYWHVIEEACLRGLSFFSFGRSIKESGTFLFKSRWGAVPVPLYYQYYVHKKAPADFSQNSGERKRLAAVWKKLPLSAANIIGPWLRKYYS